MAMDASDGGLGLGGSFVAFLLSGVAEGLTGQKASGWKKGRKASVAVGVPRAAREEHSVAKTH
jgi:hypothetical protein